MMAGTLYYQDDSGNFSPVGSLNERIKEMEEYTKYTIQTTNAKDATLMVNAIKLALAVDDVISYYCRLYNGKDYSTSYVCDGKIYSQEEYYQKYVTTGEKEPEDVIEVLTVDEVLNSLKECISDVESLVYDCLE